MTCVDGARCVVVAHCSADLVALLDDPTGLFVPTTEHCQRILRRPVELRSKQEMQYLCSFLRQFKPFQELHDDEVTNAARVMEYESVRTNALVIGPGAPGGRRVRFVLKGELCIHVNASVSGPGAAAPPGSGPGSATKPLRCTCHVTVLACTFFFPSRGCVVRLFGLPHVSIAAGPCGRRSIELGCAVACVCVCATWLCSQRNCHR